jgi:hypothetical protein
MAKDKVYTQDMGQPPKEPDDASVGRKYVPEQLGSGIRVDGKKLPPEPKQTSKPALEDDERGTKAIKAFGDAMSLRKKMDRQISDNMTNISFKKGGSVSSASSRADGIAQRGKTKGTIVMCGGGMARGRK